MSDSPVDRPRRPRIVLGYPLPPSAAFDNADAIEQQRHAALRAAGFDVTGFCLTLDPPNHCLSFPELDARWRRGEKTLMRMYEQLEQQLRTADVLLNECGINLHPEFVEQLPVFTVFQCFDDPENSANLSQPAAAAYDLSLVGNIAELATYRRWGVQRAEWVPLGVRRWNYDNQLTEADILQGDRDVDLLLIGDRTSPWRRDRLEQLAAAFPDGHFYGKGWPRGLLPQARAVPLMRRARIGPNIHNSTGPVNLRTYCLPANGVLQICDNRAHLGQIFELGKEVIGFDNLREGIELCRYYLAHDQERRQIAARGWKRAMTHYTEVAVFQRTEMLIMKYWQPAAVPAGRPAVAIAQRQRRQTRFRRPFLAVASRVRRLRP